MRHTKIAGFMLALLVASCSDQDQVGPKATYLNALSSVSQVGYKDEPAPEQAVVQVLNKDRMPMAGVEVVFEVVEGNAELQHSAILTDANGIAFTTITLSAVPNVIIQASADGIQEPIYFFIKVSAARASILELISGNDQEALAGTQLQDNFVVKVTDDFGNVFSGLPVNFFVREGNGTISETVLTDASGLAFSKLNLSSSTTTNRVVAKVALDSVEFTANSLYPTSVHVRKAATGIRISWDQSINENFSHYVIYRADSRFPNSFSTVQTFNDKGVTEFEDNTQFVHGRSYLYKVAIFTQKMTKVESGVDGVTFGDYVQLSGDPVDMEIDELRGKIYVSVRDKNEIHVIDIESRQLLEKISIGSFPKHIDLSQDNQTLYVALSGSGEIAALNLNTKAITRINVLAVLGDPLCFDVVEGAPNRLFVTANPAGFGISYLVVVKLNESNAVARYGIDVMRNDGRIEVDYGKYLYVNDDKKLYKFDLTSNNLIRVNEFSTAIVKTINHTGDRIYLQEGQAVSTADFSIIKDYGAGLATVNSDDSQVHFLFSGAIKSFNTATHALMGQIEVEEYDELQFKLDSDDSIFYVLSRIGSSYRVYLIKQ